MHWKKESIFRNIWSNMIFAATRGSCHPFGLWSTTLLYRWLYCHKIRIHCSFCDYHKNTFIDLRSFPSKHCKHQYGDEYKMNFPRYFLSVHRYEQSRRRQQSEFSSLKQDIHVWLTVKTDHDRSNATFCFEYRVSRMGDYSYFVCNEASQVCKNQKRTVERIATLYFPI